MPSKGLFKGITRASNDPYASNIPVALLGGLLGGALGAGKHYTDPDRKYYEEKARRRRLLRNILVGAGLGAGGGVFMNELAKTKDRIGIAMDDVGQKMIADTLEKTTLENPPPPPPVTDQTHLEAMTDLLDSGFLEGGY